MKHNLFSISQFCDSDYEVVYDKNNCTVIEKSIVLTRNRKCNVYKINFSNLGDQKIFFLLSVSDEKWLWHKSLRHVSWRLTFKLSKLKFVKGLPNLKYHSDVLYGACQKGKIVKNSFKSKNIFSTCRFLDQLALHSSLEINMDKL